MRILSINCSLVVFFVMCLTAQGFTTPTFAATKHAVGLKASISIAEEDRLIAFLEKSVDNLKRVLVREYSTFFKPMQREYYSSDVTFSDPLNNIKGIDNYQNNVDMLGSRTGMGSVLFQDAGIMLHDITGGEVIINSKNEVVVKNIVTRWTLRMTIKVLPWQPTARFTGISEYQVYPQNMEHPELGVEIRDQKDYWDSINLPDEGGQYEDASLFSAITDLLGQLAPNSANTAAPEVPYQLLRRRPKYQVRRYPAMTCVRTKYENRAEGFLTLGEITKGMTVFGPSIAMVPANRENKMMLWPVSIAAPGESTPPPVEGPDRDDYDLVTLPERVVAVSVENDRILTEKVVLDTHRWLRVSLLKDNLFPPDEEATMLSTTVMFAQYGAVYGVNEKAGEVWITLNDDGHPY